MPFYEYHCEACGKDFVLLQTMTAKAEDTACPYCEKTKARKLVSKFSSGGGSVCSVGGRSWGGG
jgi:putative FmdB family regulatory protein